MSNFGTVDPYRFHTKGALREAVKQGEDPEVYDTSVHNCRGTIKVSELQPSDVIIGPNVYKNRKWYANYKNGKIV